MKCLCRAISDMQEIVAPVRERGLKCPLSVVFHLLYRRSREGAWIEIIPDNALVGISLVAPVRERGLKYEETHTRDH